MNQKTVKRLRKATKLAREIIAGEKSGENRRSFKTLFNRVKKHYLAMNSKERGRFKNRQISSPPVKNEKLKHEGNRNTL